MKEKLLTTEEVAELLRVHHTTVRRWLRKGEIQGIKIGRLWRIKESELDLIEHKNKNKPE